MHTYIRKYASVLSHLCIIIIAVIPLIPAFAHVYFTMHDDQHIARLFLLDQGILQGTLYPRWVDQLGFGYGYPLFNFYPPLIYYVAEMFVSIGFGYITSIKLMLLVGSLVGTYGIYFLTKKMYGHYAAFTSAILFTFFNYRAITLYVRGSFAEYFALSVLPWVFIAIYKLKEKADIKRSMYVAITFCLLICAHPFVAVPSILFISIFTLLLYYLETPEKREKFIQHILAGILLALATSAFFWLPSALERKYTLVDAILLKELASYALHFVYPQQLWYSPWGYGGSVDGLGDGMSFQINKVYLGVIAGALGIWLSNIYLSKKPKTSILTGYFFIMLALSIFFMLPLSMFLWERLLYFQYLQFPWRFMAFVGFFIAIIGGAGIHYITSARVQKIAVVLIFFMVALVQFKYFKPQQYIETTDAARIDFKEIAWRVSGTSFEFVPKGVKTKKTSYNTTTLAINEKDIGDKTHSIIEGNASVELISKRYDYKKLRSDAVTPITLRLHIYNFPGWRAFIDGNETAIHDSNNFKLIEVHVPSGKHIVEFRFMQTPIRVIAGGVSLLSWLYIIATLYLLFGRKQSK